MYIGFLHIISFNPHSILEMKIIIPVVVRETKGTSGEVKVLPSATQLVCGRARDHVCLNPLNYCAPYCLS